MKKQLMIILGAVILLSSCTQLPKPTTSKYNQINCAQQLPATTQCSVQQIFKEGKQLSIFGNVVIDDNVYINGGVEIGADGKITNAGCIEVPAESTMINCAEHIILPGLINAHDHLSFNYLEPGGNKIPTAEILHPAIDYNECNDPINAYTLGKCASYRYDRRNQWRKGINGKRLVSAPVNYKLPSEVGTENLPTLLNMVAELRHIMTGTTTIAGPTGVKGLARNPDNKGLDEGLKLNGKIVDYNVFPLGVTDRAGKDNSIVDCNSDKTDSPLAVTFQGEAEKTLDNLIFLPHVAEGLDNYAHTELRCLTNNKDEIGSAKLQAPNSTFIHMLAATPNDAEKIKDAGTSLVWSPRSNISLYGNTAPVSMFDKKGINIALSTDWTPSGSVSMPRELVCASDYNRDYLAGHFNDIDLVNMATKNAAKALGLSDQLGQIKIGYWADLSIFKQSIDATSGEYLGAVLNTLTGANASTVDLVLRAGRPIYGDTDVINTLTSDNEKQLYAKFGDDDCLNNRSILLPQKEGTDLNIEGQALLDKMLAVNEQYLPLYSCQKPLNEPSCVPVKYAQYSGIKTTDDLDGDGIVNTADNCPMIFNPIRPMDNGKQMDICL